MSKCHCAYIHTTISYGVRTNTVCSTFLGYILYTVSLETLFGWCCNDEHRRRMKDRATGHPEAEQRSPFCALTLQLTEQFVSCSTWYVLTVFIQLYTRAGLRACRENETKDSYYPCNALIQVEANCDSQHLSCSLVQFHQVLRTSYR